MDKSNTVVIMKRDRYVSEEHWQLLHVSKHNVQVPVPNSLKLYDDIKRILSEMHINRSLDKAAYKFLNDNKKYENVVIFIFYQKTPHNSWTHLKRFNKR